MSVLHWALLVLYGLLLVLCVRLVWMSRSRGQERRGVRRRTVALLLMASLLPLYVLREGLGDTALGVITALLVVPAIVLLVVDERSRA